MGGCVYMSSKVLIRNLVCKSFANCMQLYVFLFFLALSEIIYRGIGSGGT